MGLGPRRGGWLQSVHHSCRSLGVQVRPQPFQNQCPAVTKSRDASVGGLCLVAVAMAGWQSAASACREAEQEVGCWCWRLCAPPAHTSRLGVQWHTAEHVCMAECLLPTLIDGTVPKERAPAALKPPIKAAGCARLVALESSPLQLVISSVMAHANLPASHQGRPADARELLS